MENNTVSNPNNPKKPYEKPEIRRVDLRPEEAVLGSCKTTGSAGPGTIGCNTAGVGCSSSGS